MTIASFPPDLPKPATTLTWRLSLIDFLAFTGIFIFSGEILSIVFPGALAPLEDIIFLGIYAASLFFILMLRIIPKLVLFCPVLLLLIIFPLLSAFWSIDTKLTISRSIGVVGTSLFGLLLGWYYNLHRFLLIATAALCLSSLACFFFIGAVPSVGVHQSGPWVGTWTGIHNHKNGLGGVASVTFLMATYALCTSRTQFQILVAVFTLLLSGILLAGCKSATSQMVTIIGLLLGVFIYLFQRHTRFAILLIYLGLGTVPIIIYKLWGQDVVALLIENMGKDATFSSRISIWELVWPYIEDRWWLGYGYGAFWQDNLPWIDQIEAKLFFTPFYSHNGLVELWLAGGTIAVLLLFINFFVTSIKSTVLVMKNMDKLYTAFPIIFLITYIFRNVTESLTQSRNDVLWIFFIALVAYNAKNVVFSIKKKKA